MKGIDLGRCHGIQQSTGHFWGHRGPRPAGGAWQSTDDRQRTECSGWREQQVQSSGHSRHSVFQNLLESWARAARRFARRFCLGCGQMGVGMARAPWVRRWTDGHWEAALQGGAILLWGSRRPVWTCSPTQTDAGAHTFPPPRAILPRRLTSCHSGCHAAVSSGSSSFSSLARGPVHS